LEAPKPQLDDSLTAGVVLATLEHCHGSTAEFSRYQGGISLGELFLERLGSRGDDYALTRTNCGYEVGEGFTGARSRLHDEVGFIGEGVLHGFCHTYLTVARLPAARQGRSHSA
jgi:hypothetical protein